MSITQLTLDADGFKEEEVEVEHVEGSAGTEDGVWSNTTEVPITSITAVVPATLVNKLSSIEQKVDSKMEFGVYIKGHLENGSRLIVEDDIYIPRQEVTGGSIDFLEDEPDVSFNGVCHRHPTGCNSFSSVDNGSINRNYEFSLLYVNGDIRIGIINIRSGLYRYQLPLHVIHGYTEDIDISKITPKAPVAPKFIRSGNTVINTATMSPVSPASAAYKEYKRLQKKMKKNSNSILDYDAIYGGDDDDSIVPATFQ